MTRLKITDKINFGKTIAPALILSVILIAVIAAAGCVGDKTETDPIESVPVKIPQDIHEGIHAVHSSINLLEISIAADIHDLEEKIEKAETFSDKNKVILEYYSNNLWIRYLIYYDAENNLYSSYPVITNSAQVINSIPYPSEADLRKSPDGVFTKSCVFIHENGYMNLYCKGIFDDDGKYLGYFIVITNLYVQFNLHPVMIDLTKTYGDFVVFITDANGKIIYSSNQEAVGQEITDKKFFYDGKCLIKYAKDESGAYQYKSRSFYANQRDEETEKITAWHVIDKGDYKYTIYLVKEIDLPELIYEDVFTMNTENTITDVKNLYTFNDWNGIQKAIERVNSGYYSTNIYIMDMDGNVIAAPEKEYIGLNFINNRGLYGYSYTRSMIDTVNQGGGFVYYTFPIDDTVDPSVAEYSVSYVLPLDEEHFVMGRFAGDTDLIMKNDNLKSDITLISREIVKEAYYNGINYVIDKINNNSEAGGSIFVEGLDSDINDISIVDMEGKVYASTEYQNIIGNEAMGYKDVYGGSTTRKAIIIAKSGGGFLSNLSPNPDKEGYVDLWVVSIEPIDNTYYSYVGVVVKTIKDDLSQYIIH